MKQNKLVYIASPYAGDVEINVSFAKAACRYAMEQGCIPIAVHLIYPQLLNDTVPEEREAGIRMGLRVLEACDELWLCGEQLSQSLTLPRSLVSPCGAFQVCCWKPRSSLKLTGHIPL